MLDASYLFVAALGGSTVITNQRAVVAVCGTLQAKPGFALGPTHC